MAITYPYIGTNPQPVVPAGNTPQQRYQTGMSLGMVNPFATSAMMPASPMARTDYLEPTMAAIAARTTQPLQTPTSVAMPTAPLARSGVVQGQQQGVPLPRPRPANMPPSGLDQLRAAQLRMPARGTPADAGLRAAASTGLQLSGYQDRPMTLGQGLGAMLGAYTEAEQATAQRQAEAQQQALSNELAMMQLYQKAMPDPSKYRQMAIDAGFNPDTPEGIEYIKHLQAKPSGVQVNLGAEGDQLMQEFSIKEGIKQINKMQEAVQGREPLIQIYGQMKPLIMGGMRTGALEETMLPIRNLAASLGFLSPDERSNLSDQELFLKLSKEASTFMRPAGSGATSDFEAVTYQTITAKLDNTPESNLKRIAGALQIHEYNKKKMAFYEDFFRREKTTMGANTEWDKQGITPFPNYMTPESMYNDLQSGNLQVGMMYINDDMNSKTAGFNLLTPEYAQALEQKYGK